MTQPYVLYGAQSSYYTARVRACLRKKSVPYVERLPSVPRYRAHVRPAAGTHRIPVIETPDGLVIQDSTVIIDHLDAAFPDPPALPPGPRQHLAAQLMSVLGVEGLLQPAMHYRWNYPDENLAFIIAEFGRSLRPGGTPAEVEAAGRLVAGRMSSKLLGLGITPQTVPAIEAAYHALLALLDAHFFCTPYFLGDIPGVADYALIGPLYAHLGRDPAPLRLMQTRAPSLFRWVEQMNAPGLDYAEFPAATGAYPADDQIPPTAVAVLRHLVRWTGAELIAFAGRYNAWVNEQIDLPAGAPLATDTDQPLLGEVEAAYPSGPARLAARAHALWLLQRPLDDLNRRSGAERGACDGLVAEIDGAALMGLRLARPLVRTDARLCLG